MSHNSVYGNCEGQITAWARNMDSLSSTMAINICSKHLVHYQKAQWKTIAYYEKPQDIFWQPKVEMEIQK